MDKIFLNIKIRRPLIIFYLLIFSFILILSILYMSISSNIINFSYEKTVLLFLAYFKILIFVYGINLISWPFIAFNKRNYSVIKFKLINKNTFFIICVILLFLFSYKINRTSSSNIGLFSMLFFLVGILFYFLSIGLFNSVQQMQVIIDKVFFIKNLKINIKKYFSMTAIEIHNFIVRIKLSLRKIFNFIIINYKKTKLLNLFHKIKCDFIDENFDQNYLQY